MHSRISILLLCTGLFLSPWIASRAMAAPEEDAASGSAGLANESRFGIQAGAYFGIGEVGMRNTVDADRAIGSFSLQAMPGWRLPNYLMAGLLADLRFHSQLDQDASGITQDYSGKSLSLGLGLSYEPGKARLLLSYDPWARHWLNNKDLTFRGSGFHFLVGYKYEKNSALDLEFNTSHFNSVHENAYEYGIGTSPLGLWSLSLGMSISY